MKSGKDHESMSVLEQLREGLKESLAAARGELTLKSTTLPAPAPRLTKDKVSAIRRRAGMSQSVFASYLNVPKKTLQSWEQGARVPKAGEARLLQLFAIAPKETESLVLQADRKLARSKAAKQPRRRAG